MKVITFSHTFASGWKNLPKTSELDSPKTLVLAFCSPKYREKAPVLKELGEMFPQSVVTGCSTSGEIVGDEIHDLSMQIVVMQLATAEIKLVTETVKDPGDSQKVGQQIGESLKGDLLKGVLVLTDGLKANGSFLVEGLKEGLADESISVSGGLAGDGNQFQETWILDQGEAKLGMIAAIGFYGEHIHIDAASRGGFDVFGPERVITKSHGNVIHSIDNRPALDWYKEHLGDKAAELPAAGLQFPLQFWSPDDPKKKLVRTLLSVDEEEKTLSFAADLPEGYCVQLLKANNERVIDGASIAGEDIRDKQEHVESPNSVTIAISCVGRRLLLGDRAVEELEALQESLGRDAQVVGFYSYGELAPYVRGQECVLHNQTMTITSIYEPEEVNAKKVA